MNACDLLRSAINKLGSLEMKVAGNSMSPFLLSGEKVLLLPADNIVIGDVVAHPGRRSGMPVLHRVIDITASTIETMGDNSLTPTKIDPPSVIAVFSALWLDQLGIWCKAPLSSHGSFDLANISLELRMNLKSADSDSAALDNLVKLRRRKGEILRDVMLQEAYGASSRIDGGGTAG